MPGTADPVDVWLLLEYRPAWRAKAVDDNDLAADVREWFGGLTERIGSLGLKARPQFVRQPELDRSNLTLMIAADGSLFDFRFADYRTMCELDVLEVVSHPERYLSARIDQPRYFVCTNGQRDLCCARFGLPIYQALRERLGDRVWQATHLGGHRFAPNVLTLPQSVLYGRVPEAALDGFVDDVESGHLHLPLLRGRHGFEQPVQAAEAFLLGLAGPGWTLCASVESDGEWHVTFRRNAEQVALQVTRKTQPDLILKSCADSEEQAVYPFQIAVETAPTGSA